MLVVLPLVVVMTSVVPFAAHAPTVIPPLVSLPPHSSVRVTPLWVTLQAMFAPDVNVIVCVDDDVPDLQEYVPHVAQFMPPLDDVVEPLLLLLLVEPLELELDVDPLDELLDELLDEDDALLPELELEVDGGRCSAVLLVCGVLRSLGFEPDAG